MTWAAVAVAVGSLVVLAWLAYRVTRAWLAVTAIDLDALADACRRAHWCDEAGSFAHYYTDGPARDTSTETERDTL